MNLFPFISSFIECNRLCTWIHSFRFSPFSMVLVPVFHSEIKLRLYFSIIIYFLLLVRPGWATRVKYQTISIHRYGYFYGRFVQIFTQVFASFHWYCCTVLEVSYTEHFLHFSPFFLFFVLNILEKCIWAQFKLSLMETTDCGFVSLFKCHISPSESNDNNGFLCNGTIQFKLILKTEISFVHY